MKLDEKSTVSAVAVAVGSTLLERGIHAVLTGGACVSLYTGGVEFPPGPLAIGEDVAIRSVEIRRSGR